VKSHLWNQLPQDGKESERVRASRDRREHPFSGQEDGLPPDVTPDMVGEASHDGRSVDC